ncbi:hypothetical protein SSOG_00458 [Streptomyces himastatinicus ATCC 53653]|uniref:Transposase n=1 Tax=Streptomyces himastatinicus ATCC 53653 TaxID=457427 RepID=D9WAV2_9ACTN|nr:hypothetical protein SSOG_00458 [Streptomyces himastatinicus ATCC 53653]
MSGGPLQHSGVVTSTDEVSGTFNVLRVLSTYAGHYNGHRPHQAREQLPPLADHHTAPLTDLKTPGRLLQTRVLGGLINEYRYAA